MQQLQGACAVGFRWEMVGEKEPAVISVGIKETITLRVISQQ